MGLSFKPRSGKHLTLAKFHHEPLKLVVPTTDKSCGSKLVRERSTKQKLFSSWYFRSKISRLLKTTATGEIKTAQKWRVAQKSALVDSPRDELIACWLLFSCAKISLLYLKLVSHDGLYRSQRSTWYVQTWRTRLPRSVVSLAARSTSSTIRSSLVRATFSRPHCHRLFRARPSKRSISLKGSRVSCIFF